MLKKFRNFQKIICRIYFSDWHSCNILQYSVFCQPLQKQHFTDFIVANLRLQILLQIVAKILILMLAKNLYIVERAKKPSKIGLCLKYYLDKTSYFKIYAEIWNYLK